jgi:hypothetical protein
VTATASTRRSGLEPTATRVTSLEEIDYIDVFDFFNVPKIREPPPTQMRAFGGSGPPVSSVEAVAGGISQQALGMTGHNPEADWLGY